jgi:hypothetical protein
MAHFKRRSLNLLEAFEAFERRSSVVVAEFTKARDKQDHLRYIVLHQCVVAQNTFQTIAAILKTNQANPEIAFGLCRTLLDIACSSIYLIQHPSELDYFRSFGELKRLKLSKTLGSLSAEDSVRLGEIEERFKQKKRRNTTWHGQGAETFILGAGFSQHFIAIHNEASSVLHGDALGSIEYALEEHGDLFRAPALGRRFPAAFRISTNIHEHLLVFVDRSFDLGIDSLSEVSALAAMIRALVPTPLLD